MALLHERLVSTLNVNTRNQYGLVEIKMYQINLVFSTGIIEDSEDFCQ